MKLAEAMEGKEKPEKKDSGGELRRISIEPAENGYTVICEREPKKTKGKGNEPMCCTYQEPEKYVFESVESVLEYIKGELED